MPNSTMKKATTTTSTTAVDLATSFPFGQVTFLSSDMIPLNHFQIRLKMLGLSDLAVLAVFFGLLFGRRSLRGFVVDDGLLELAVHTLSAHAIFGNRIIVRRFLCHIAS